MSSNRPTVRWPSSPQELMQEMFGSSSPPPPPAPPPSSHNSNGYWDSSPLPGVLSPTLAAAPGSATASGTNASIHSGDRDTVSVRSGEEDSPAAGGGGGGRAATTHSLDGDGDSDGSSDDGEGEPREGSTWGLTTVLRNCQQRRLKPMQDRRWAGAASSPASIALSPTGVAGGAAGASAQGRGGRGGGGGLHPSFASPLASGASGPHGLLSPHAAVADDGVGRHADEHTHLNTAVLRTHATPAVAKAAAASAYPDLYARAVSPSTSSPQSPTASTATAPAMGGPGGSSQSTVEGERAPDARTQWKVHRRLVSGVNRSLESPLHSTHTRTQSINSLDDRAGAAQQPSSVAQVSLQPPAPAAERVRRATTTTERVWRGLQEGPVRVGSISEAVDVALRPAGGIYRVKLFALFGMLERATRFDELTALCQQHPEVGGFLQRVTQCLRGMAATDGFTDGLRAHLLLMHVLTTPALSERVGEAFFSDPLNAWPLHVLYLTGCFYATARRVGYGRLLAALRANGGLTATGKGVFAALAVSMAASEEELPETTARMCVAAFCVGVLMRQSREALGAEAIERLSQRCFALLLVNIPMFSLRQLVTFANRGGVRQLTTAPLGSRAGALRPSRRIRPVAPVEVSRVVSRRSAIVTGHPLDLMRLDILLTRYADFNGVKIHKDYLPATAPENSEFFNGRMLYDLISFWDSIGPLFDPMRLQLDVFSPVDGEPWAARTVPSQGTFSHKVAEAVTSAHHDLTFSLQHMDDGDVLLDFSTNALNVGPIIAWTNKDITILAAPGDRREESALPPLRRSPQDTAVRGTLAKLAIINQVLREEARDRGMPAPRRPVETFTTFTELGFLCLFDGRAPPAASEPSASVSSPSGFSRQNSISSPVVPGKAVSGPSERALPHRTPQHRHGRSNSGSGTGGGGGGGSTTATVSRAEFFSDRKEYVVNPNPSFPSVVNVFQVSPLIRYYEMQFGCVLAPQAVTFMERLAARTGVDFPVYALLICPDIFALLEMWDGFEFVSKWEAYL